MKMPFTLRLAVILGILSAYTLRADVVTQNFEAFPLNTSKPPANTTTNGWTINDTQIRTGLSSPNISPHSGTKFAILTDGTTASFGTSGTNSYVETPILTNGVGSVSYYLHTWRGVGPHVCEVRYSTNETDWVTVQTVTNTSTVAWTPYTAVLNIYAPVRLRFFKAGPLTTDLSVIVLDDISTTEAPAKVDVSDLAIAPTSPVGGEAVTVSALLTPSALATITDVDLLWSANGGSSNTISMSYNSGSGRYETDTPITDQPAFTVIDYSVVVTFGGPTPLSPASASDSFFFRLAPLVSAYNSVSVKGDLPQTLDLVADGYWAGIKSVGALGQTDVYFETIDSVTNRWSDPEPLRTNLPVFGAFATNVLNDISIASADAGFLLVSFDENSGRYGIQQADYQSFNSTAWDATVSFGIHNNVDDGWTLREGRTTTDTALAFDGRSVQFTSTTVDRAIESPELPDGIGTITFRYRNTETNGASPAAFAIQVRPTLVAPWSTVETLDTIISPDYLYHSYTVASLDQRYIRIAATNGVPAAQLLIDDIVITRPGATVTFSGLGHTPPAPTILDTVDVSVGITALNGAELGSVTLWFRGGSNGVYDAITMTNTVPTTTYTATIPRGARGEMQYYVEANYLNPATGGYQAASDPLDSTGFPAAYTNTDVSAGTQNFTDFPLNTSSPPIPTTVNGWTINDTQIRSSLTSPSIAPYSGTKFALLMDAATAGVSGTNSYVETPLLSNGVGSVSFYLHTWRGAGPHVCDVRFSTNETDWVTAQTVTNTSTTAWTQYTIPLNIYTPVRLRLFKGGEVTADLSVIVVDDISLSYPPAYVTSSDFELHPAYPSQEGPTMVACTIESATIYHPAFNIAGVLKYRVNDQVNGWPATWNSVAMYRNGSRFDADIPAQLNLSQVEYYVEANFKGYSAEGSDQSPMTFPDDPLVYSVRRYPSAYEQMNIVIGSNTTDFVQLGNGMWEGVITFIDPTNEPAFNIEGYGYYDGTNITSGLSDTWGDNNQFSTNLPLASTATIDGLPITIPELAEGQYMIRFDENTGTYSVQRVAFQDFENWPADTEFFGESYAAAELTQHIQPFEAWTLSDLNLTTDSFEAGWTNAYPYPDNWSIPAESTTTGVNRRYVIGDGIVVTQLVGQAALLNDIVGNVRIQADFPGDTGSFAFDLRCANPNDFQPAIYNGLSSNSIMITVDMKALDIPTNATLNSVGFAYKSLLANYIDDNNFYEVRIAQTGAATRRIELWKKEAGSYTTSTPIKKANLSGGAITEEDTFSLVLNRLSSTRVKMRMYGGRTGSVNEWDDARDGEWDDNGSALAPSAIFGLNSFDASVSVNSVKVYANTNNSTAYTTALNLYSEDFTSGASGWIDSSGVWSVADGRYGRPGYTGPPLTARVSFSTDLGSNWDPIEDFTNLTHSCYQRYTTTVHNATSGLVRVRNVAGNGYMLIDNVERTAWRGKAVSTNGWQASNTWVGTVNETNRIIELRHSRALAGASQQIISPTLSGGASVISFDYRPAEDTTGTVAFAIQYEDTRFPGIWEPATTVTNSSSPTNWVRFSYSIAERELRTNIWRLLIENLTPGHDDGLLLDNIIVTEPPPINDTTWWGYNVLVTDQQPDTIVYNDDNPWRAWVAGNAFGAFLNNSNIDGTGGVTNSEYNPFIQSAYLPDGIGEIRFLYRAWDTNASTIQVVASTNRLLPQAQWAVMDTLSVTNFAYQEYYNAVFERSYRYVALRVNSQNGSLGRVGVDNITITAPLAADLQLSDLRLSPEVPLFSDDVYVEVTVGDLFFNPTNIQLQLLHKVGTGNWGDYTNGTWTAYDMEDHDHDGIYRSMSPILPKAIDTVVQYQIKATFGGFFADKSSPKYYRSFVTPDHYWPVDLNRDQPNQTPYYYSFSCLPGQVWINELNIKDDEFSPPGPQYVEVVGVGNAGVGNWRIEVINPTSYTTNSSYTIPGGTTLGSAADDYGFYVLGDTTVANRNLTLTNTLPDSAGIQIVRSMGAFEDQVSFDVATEGPGKAMSIDPDHRFVYAGVEQTWFTSASLSLTGTGSNSADFAWSNIGDFNTIGSTNTGQTLIPWPTNGPVIPGEYTGTATIGTASMSGGLVYFNISTQATNLVPSVWYVTNLLNVTSNDWQERLSGFNYTRTNTTYYIECDEVPPPAFYSIKVTREP